jgi:hypothetical protein
MSGRAHHTQKQAHFCGTDGQRWAGPIRGAGEFGSLPSDRSACHHDRATTTISHSRKSKHARYIWMLIESLRKLLKLSHSILSTRNTPELLTIKLMCMFMTMLSYESPNFTYASCWFTPPDVEKLYVPPALL